MDIFLSKELTKDSEFTTFIRDKETLPEDEIFKIHKNKHLSNWICSMDNIACEAKHLSKLLTVDGHKKYNQSNETTNQQIPTYEELKVKNDKLMEDIIRITLENSQIEIEKKVNMEYISISFDDFKLEYYERIYKQYKIWYQKWRMANDDDGEKQIKYNNMIKYQRLLECIE